MKSLKEILNSPNTTITEDIPDQKPYSKTATDPVLDNAYVEVKPPEYMYTDPGSVGYENEEIQHDTYQFAITGVIPLSGDVKILDIGCGRGDLYHFIKTRFPALSVDYTGYEINKLLSTIGNEKLEGGGEIFNIDFLSDSVTKPSEKFFDHTFIIGTLNIDYIRADKWVNLELMIRKAFEFTSKSITLILLQDNGGMEMYNSFPIPNITDLILNFNCSFQIDYDNETGIYKLTLNK